MTTWQSAMLWIVPLILFAGLGGIAKLALIGRTWAAMMAASLITYTMHPIASDMPFSTYFLIDLLAGIAIAAPRSGIEQRAIAALFFVMAIIDAAAAWQRADGLGIFDTTSRILGWAMWFVLLAWGARDAGRGVVAYFAGGGVDTAVVAHHEAAGPRTGGVIEP